MATLNITSGGTYTGHYTSPDFNTPAITINTKDLVILKDILIDGPGDKVQMLTTGGKVEILNFVAVGADPIGQPNGTITGRLMNDRQQSMDRLVISHGTMYGVRGIRNKNVSGGYTRVNNVLVYHVNGMISNGSGGYRNIQGGEADATSQFFIGRKGANWDCEISGNVIVNIKNLSARPSTLYELIPILQNEYTNAVVRAATGQEDLINFNSNGQSAKPIIVQDNILIGSYPVINFLTWGQRHSGTAFITDGGDNDQIRIRNNGAFNCQNSSFSLNDGKANMNTVEFHDNIVLNSSLAPGWVPGLDRWTWMGKYTKVGFSYQFNSYQGGLMYDNQSAGNNTTQVKTNTGQNDWSRKDYNLGNCPAGNCTGNTSIQPGDKFIDRALELQYILQMAERLLDDGYSPGTRPTTYEVRYKRNNQWFTRPSETTTLTGNGPIPTEAQVRYICSNRDVSPWSNIATY